VVSLAVVPVRVVSPVVVPDRVVNLVVARRRVVSPVVVPVRVGSLAVVPVRVVSPRVVPRPEGEARVAVPHRVASRVPGLPVVAMVSRPAVRVAAASTACHRPGLHPAAVVRPGRHSDPAITRRAVVREARVAATRT
jgi:hypothetical protein